METPRYYAPEVETCYSARCTRPNIGNDIHNLHVKKKTIQPFAVIFVRVYYGNPMLISQNNI